MRDLVAIAHECENVTLAELQHGADGLGRRLRTAIARPVYNHSAAVASPGPALASMHRSPAPSARRTGTSRTAGRSAMA